MLDVDRRNNLPASGACKNNHTRNRNCSSEEAQNKSAQWAGHSLTHETQQDIYTVLVANFDAFGVPPKALTILFEELRFLNEVAFRFGGALFSTNWFTAEAKPLPLVWRSCKLATPARYSSWLRRTPLPKEIEGQS